MAHLGWCWHDSCQPRCHVKANSANGGCNWTAALDVKRIHLCRPEDTHSHIYIYNIYLWCIYTYIYMYILCKYTHVIISICGHMFISIIYMRTCFAWIGLGLRPLDLTLLTPTAANPLADPAWSSHAEVTCRSPLWRNAACRMNSGYPLVN